LRHLPIFERRTEIDIRPKRYRCPDCRDHPTTTQRLDCYDPRSAFTREFEQSLLRGLINSILEEVVHKDAITTEHLEGILDRYIPGGLDWTALPALPVLGLDEIALRKGRGNFVEIASARVEDTLSAALIIDWSTVAKPPQGRGTAALPGAVVVGPVGQARACARAPARTRMGGVERRSARRPWCRRAA
jgi:hypothetical protein